MGRYRIRITDLDTCLIVLDEEFGTDKSDAFREVLMGQTKPTFRQEPLKKRDNDTDR